MKYLLIFTLLLGLAQAQTDCLTWVAPENLTQGYVERVEWELRSYDLIDWESQPCKHKLRIELKPILSQWHVFYQFGQKKLKKQYPSLEAFAAQISNDLDKIMGTYRSGNLESMSAKYQSNKWRLLKAETWPLFELAIFSETRYMDQQSQSLLGLDFAITRNIGPWQSELAFGAGYNSAELAEMTSLINWGTHLKMAIEYALFDLELHSPVIRSGLSLQGLWIETPEQWKGGGLSVFPELSVGVGWRAFRAHQFNVGFETDVKIPMSDLDFYDVNADQIKSYYPWGWGFKLQCGF